MAAPNKMGCNDGKSGGWDAVNLWRIEAAANPSAEGPGGEESFGATWVGMWKMEGYKPRSWISCMASRELLPGRDN